MNIAVALKNEVSRVARKEIRAEMQSTKKASTQYRSDIAALKRRITALEKMVSRLGKSAGAAARAEVADDDAGPKVRFSPGRFAAQRKRLELSAADLGRLIGVSGAAVYLWEQGKTRPRPAQLQSIAALRKMGKREIGQKLAALK